ncbi:tRNA (guanosine(46)-N7)-methyltransferase TrmB [Clostridium fallax]|uniref:tRNA (guanine-N(7)-)-methyltransferase n=1 Tax=Clostridium fallax TaxID=1533 RepID=A0A1M4U8P7_9CLOT|nr:tRNA (guanosine(46)-N7)-methyltransferase TrmB [Clostridium fallax]SHE52950.1 tRNA (guanine-N(7)-)-methyltransferase [Clostridium fallax]SQB06129.1 tRNA (guanine-N(7)-)-methyltransferase [Clostridium fallax]
MRLRKKPWARPELESSDFFIIDPREYKEKWSNLFNNDNPIHLELGCGKGNFVCKHGVNHPERNYIAIDIKDEVLVLAKRNIEEEFKKAGKDKVENVKLTALEIAFIEEVFGKNEISQIYINFCNPWPKKKHKKRRLTHNQFLERYKKFLKADGEIWFKTDDDELFLESQEYFTQSGFAITYITYDLHESGFKDNVVTEHERMFTEMEIKTKFLIAKLIN